MGWCDDEIKEILLRIQNDLFIVGSDLANPDMSKNEMRTTDEMVTFLEEKIDLEQMISGYESGSISEAFGVGTAAAVANITSITHKDQKLLFKMNKNGLAEKLKTILQNIQFGKSEDPFGWRVKVN